MHTFPHRPSVGSSSYEREAKSSAFNLTTLHNPYAVAVTEEISNLISPQPTHSPEGHSANLHEIIAQHEGVEPDNVYLANGLWHLLHQFFTSLAPRKVVIIGPLPQEYYLTLDLLNIPFHPIALSPEVDFQLSPQALQSLWETQADLVILSTPNLLTGTTLTSLQAVFSMIRAPRVLIDASLQEFLYPSSEYHNQRYKACLSYLRPGISLFMLNNLMPFFACPGLCLAYLLGDKHPLATLKRYTPPYMTTTYAQTLAERLFQRIDDFRATLPQLTTDRINTAITLRRSPLFNPDYVFEGPSFICAALTNHKAASAILDKLHKHHIGLLSIPKTMGIPPGFVRMSVANNQNLAYIEQTCNAIADEF